MDTLLTPPPPRKKSSVAIFSSAQSNAAANHFLPINCTKFKASELSLEMSGEHLNLQFIFVNADLVCPSKVLRFRRVSMLCHHLAKRYLIHHYNLKAC